MPLPVTDTRHAFRPLSGEIVGLLRSLSVDDWTRPTLAGSWRVRDVVAHLVDTALRRLSFHRDGSMPPSDAGPSLDDRKRGRTPFRRRQSPKRGTAPFSSSLVDLVNDLNRSWVHAARRLSPRALTDLYAHASGQLADFVESLSLEGEALFPVSWAGEAQSALWFDIGREFTEVWHHGAQIREAVGAGPFSDPRWLRAVLEIAVRALPHAYRDVPGHSGLSVAIVITGRAPGAWTLTCGSGAWELEEGGPARSAAPAATATMTDENAWRLFFNAVPPHDAQSLVHVDGDAALALPLLRARSVIV